MNPVEVIQNLLLKTYSLFGPLLFFYFQSNDSGLFIAFILLTFVVSFIGVIGFVAWYLPHQKARELQREQQEMANMSDEQKEQYSEHKQKKRLEYLRSLSFGDTKPAMVCPHCQTKGHVRTKRIAQKKGISGGKATGAILTGGISLLATGLSRTELATQAHCDNCESTWHF
jgi:hypothetical protein